jgi:hypothetical protein
MSLPAPYTHGLAPDDPVRYGATLSAQQAEALRLRLAGLLYPQIGTRLGVTTARAREVVRQACGRLARAQQEAAARTLREDTP